MKKIIFLYSLFYAFGENLNDFKLLPPNVISFVEENVFNYTNELEIKFYFSNMLYVKYIEKDSDIQKIKFSIKNEYLKQFILWSLLPTAKYDMDIISKMMGNNNIKFTWSLVAIFDSMVDLIFNDQVKNIIYNQKKKQNELILKFQNILKKLIENVKLFRTKARILVYLHKEIKRKYSNIEILTNDDIQNKYMIESLILKTSLELVNVFYEIHKIIIESNFILDDKHINYFFSIFNYLYTYIHKNIKSFDLKELLDMANSFNDTKKENIFFNKIKKSSNIGSIFKLSSFLEITVDNQLQFSIIGFLSKIIQNFLSLFFNKKILNIEVKYDEQKWKDLIKQNELYKKDNEENIIFTKDKLMFVYELINKDNLLKTIKVKNMVENYVSFIETGEELVASILLNILIKNITYRA